MVEAVVTDTSPFKFGAHAGLISQISGVMAGIAFTAIIFTVTRGQGSQPVGSRPIVGFLCAVITLIINAFMYADLAAQTSVAILDGGLVLAGAGFCLSAFLLVYCIVLLLHSKVTSDPNDLPLGDAEKAIRRTCTCVIPPLIFEFMSLAVIANLDDQHTSHAVKSATTTLALAGLVLFLAVGVLSALRPLEITKWTGHEHHWVAYGILAVNFLLALSY